MPTVKKECIAMLLAGGQGSRLYALTGRVAKPAVPFGGKYRIIDFPLSNCANSGIDTVGVLTQYKPLELNGYIGNGQPWDLDRTDGGVFILPPFVREGSSGTWYKGTANSIYQNMGFIELYSPEYVLILSGDHVYKMDYSKLLEQHKRNGAACTISVIEVPLAEACRYGIMSVGEDDRIAEFEEKPRNPKSDLASMGIYIFTWDKLRRYLADDESNPDSTNDFGHDIIPAMLSAGESLFAYRFAGYWKDVGTIDSLWDANMDMLAAGAGLNQYDPDWPIYSRNTPAPPHYAGDRAIITHSLITEGCEIYGTVENSVLFNSVHIGEGARVSYSILMPGAVVQPGAVVEYAIVAENSVIGKKARVGGQPGTVAHEDWGVAVIASDVYISDGSVVPPRAMVDSQEGGVRGE